MILFTVESCRRFFFDPLLFFYIYIYLIGIAPLQLPDRINDKIINRRLRFFFCLFLLSDIIVGKRGRGETTVGSVIVADETANTFANGNRQNFLHLKCFSPPNNCGPFNEIILFYEFNSHCSSVITIKIIT